jgi:hypothetical protein
MSTPGHSIKDYSTDPAAQVGPLGTDAPSIWDNSVRAVMAALRDVMAPADVASASTCDLGAVDATVLTITGTTGITSFGTVSAGVWKIIVFSGVLTLTHNATSLILPGAANLTTAAGDAGLAVSLGSGNWRVALFSRANGLTTSPTFTFADGALGTPSIAFTSDTNTGFYRSGADSMVAGPAVQRRRPSMAPGSRRRRPPSRPATAARSLRRRCAARASGRRPAPPCCAARPTRRTSPRSRAPR